MRIPWYICLLVSLVAFGLTYWFGAKDYDFVTPPTDEEIAEMKKKPPVNDEVLTNDKVETINSSQANATDNSLDDGDPPKVTAEETSVIRKASRINDYLDQDNKSAEAYVTLAEELVAEGNATHSLVAWERVLDSSKPSPSPVVIDRAFEILKLHKPSTKEEGQGNPIPIALNAIVPIDMLDKLEIILKNSSEMIELGSGYSLAVTPEVSVITISKKKPRPAVTIWFSGENESNLASFRTTSPDEFGLNEKINRALFNIVSPYLRERTELSPLAELNHEIDADQALAFLITRHSWHQFGVLLQKGSDQK